MPETLTPAVPLTDPTSVKSETSPADIARIPREPTEEENALYGLTIDYFKASAIGKRPFEPQVLESWAFYLAQQGKRATFSNGEWGLTDVRARSPHKVNQYRNKIRPKIKKSLAQALRNDPDKTISPWTGAPQDRAAAMIARGVDADLTNRLRDKQTLWEMSRWAATTSTTREKLFWNSKAWAEVPTGFDEDGNPTGSALAQVGAIERATVPWTEFYGDPDARSEREMRWCIHAREVSVELVKEMYPDGWMVEGGPPVDMRGATETRIANVLGGYAKGYQPLRGDRTTTVFEVWELPTIAYPERWNAEENRYEAGRWWTCTGDGRVVKPIESLPEWCRNPDDGRWELPFNALSWESPQGTTHALNAVYDLIGAQRDYNNAVSRMAEMLRTAYGKIMVCEGAQISTTAFDMAKENEVIYWRPNPGGAPVHLPAPEPNAVIIQSIEMDERDMQDIAGVHEVSEGKTPPQVTAASAIKLLQDSDTTQIADFTQELEGFIERRCSMRLRIARLMYKEPRLLFLAQTKGSKTNAQAITPSPAGPAALSGGVPGGQPGLPAPGMGASPMLTPPAANSLNGNGTGGAMQPPVQGIPGAQVQPPTLEPQGLPSPVMQAQTFEQFTAGSLRVVITPGSMTPKSPEANTELVLDMVKLGVFELPPQVAKVIVQELEIMDPNVVYESMMQAQADAAALEPDPMVAAQQQAKLDAIHAQMLAAITTHSQIAIEQAKQQGRMELEQMRDAFAKEMEAIKLHSGMITAQSTPQAGPQISVSLAGKLDPEATVSAEKQRGLETGSVEQAKQMAMPPKPAANGTKPTGGKGNAAPTSNES